MKALTWRFLYLRAVAQNMLFYRSYWSMSKPARKIRRDRIRYQYQPITLTGEAAEKATAILRRRGKL